MRDLPSGGETIPPEQIGTQLPDPPPPYNEKTVVAIKRPGQSWVYKAYDDAQADDEPPPDDPQQPKQRRV